MDSTGNPASNVPMNIAPLAGPPLLGVLFNWTLFGVMAVQYYIYYSTWAGDRLFTKAFVSSIVLLETLQTALMGADLFRIYGSGSGSGDLQSLVAIGFSWLSVPLLTGLISGGVQLYYTWRIYRFGKSPYLPVFIAAIAITQAGAAVAVGVQSLQGGSLTELPIIAAKSIPTWIISSVVCDVLIAISMIYLLAKSRTHFRKTNDMLSRLMRLTVETGLITTTVDIVDLILYYQFSQSAYYVTPGYMSSKLYSNALLALVNHRVRMTTWRQTDAEEMKSFSGVISNDTSQNSHQVDIRPSGAKGSTSGGRAAFRLPIQLSSKENNFDASYSTQSSKLQVDVETLDSHFGDRKAPVDDSPRPESV